MVPPPPPDPAPALPLSEAVQLARTQEIREALAAAKDGPPSLDEQLEEILDEVWRDEKDARMLDRILRSDP